MTRKEANASQMRAFTCGICGETFGTNCDADDIKCTACAARRCPHCGEWYGGYQ